MSKWVIWNPSHTRVNEHGVISCNIHWFQSLSVFCVSGSAQCFDVQKRIWPVWKYGVHIPSHGSKCENSPIETAIDSGKSTHYLSHTSHEKSPIKSYYLHKHTLVIHIYIYNIHIHVTPHIPLCTDSIPIFGLSIKFLGKWIPAGPGPGPGRSAQVALLANRALACFKLEEG